MGKQDIWIAAAGAAALAVAVACGCNRTGYEDGDGFSDGFVAGYGRDCTISSPANEARWRNASYSRGYADGFGKGVRACAEERGELHHVETRLDAERIAAR